MVALFQKIKNADFEYPDWFSDEGDCCTINIENHYTNSRYILSSRFLLIAAKDLLSKTLVPDPHARIKLSDMKSHPWMQHPDSGPEPPKADNSAATAGSPTVIIILFFFSCK